ncbi:glycosyltransferase family 2 protein [Niabella aurantiaca]|uniref:glycosyltransferase family 2 protein n=1 Tax=Niabella aurantiaca TaxID=379900 RepID=UPI00035D53C7|nr:glycosyltransferase family A protein [Niabella aurantiaca]
MPDKTHTFVIPAYKDSPHLENCVKSLLQQTRPTNILIATSTPSDHIKNIVARHHIPYFISDETSSIAGDWNFAMSKATTRYVTIAHQDDLYDKDFTKEVLTRLNQSQNKKPLMVFTGYTDLVNGAERKRSLNAFVKNALLFPFRIKNTIQNKWVKKAVLALGNSICCPSVTLDRQSIQEIQFSNRYTCVLDWVAWLALAKQKGAFIYIEKKLVKHRIHEDSETTNQIKIGKRQQEELTVLQSIWGKSIGQLISKVYTRGLNDNKI